MRKHKIRIGALAAALLVVLAVVAGGVATGGASLAKAEDPVILTVTGLNGASATFTMSQLQALPVYEGYACIKNSADVIKPLGSVKGADLKDVLASVGGLTAGSSVDAVSSYDGFGQTFSYDQVVNGTEAVYDQTTKEPETPDAPVSIVVIYEQNGSPLTSETGGPLRIAVCQPSNVNQAGDGHRFVSTLGTLTIHTEMPSWKVKMFGLLRHGKRQTYTFGSDDGSYDSCATPGCHGASWTNPADSNTWTGVPLFLLIGKVDGGKGHGGYGAYNEKLALKGYRIKIVSSTGAYRIIGSRVIMNRERIILAHQLMGAQLTSKYYPLRLVGPRIGSRKFVGRIVRIRLLPK